MTADNETSQDSAPVNRVVGRILSKIYSLPVDDPIEIVADFNTDDAIMSKAHHDSIGLGGVTVTCHGSGSIWLSWDDVPLVIEALKSCMRDYPPNHPCSPADASPSGAAGC